mmetsp:Transcript_4954/g.9077  ORF Transcript_4954/g.9077 Transcript_4954/m.9077 type:complete len:186 (+) Transcript_4954:47-604(+)
MSQLLRPRRLKWPKQHIRFEYPVDNRTHVLQFGTWGIKCIGSYHANDNIIRLRDSTIDAVQKVIQRTIKQRNPDKKEIKVYRRFFPDRPCTKLGAEQRMGRGKGNVDHYEAAIRKGQVIFEFSATPEVLQNALFKVIRAMLPFNVKMVKRPEPNFMEVEMDTSHLERKPDLPLEDESEEPKQIPS